MKSYQILRDGHQALKQVAQPVEKFDAKLKEMAIRMMATMRKANGIGLAANQIGILKRVIVIDTTPAVPAGKGFTGALINPEVTGFSEDFRKDVEGCLSFPGQNYLIDRNSWVLVKYQDVYGEVHEKVFEGLNATCVQHEIDHLKGITFDTKGN